LPLCADAHENASQFRCKNATKNATNVVRRPGIPLRRLSSWIYEKGGKEWEGEGEKEIEK